MISLFRKIRQNLLSDNKRGKYLKYAIGEIILVVIGILIALQINNWNQNRLLKNDEVLLVKQLLQDTKADAIFFEERLYKLKTQAYFYNNLLNLCKVLAIEKDTIILSDYKNQPFTRLANQSNVLKNNPNAYEQLLSATLKIELQKYASKYEFVYRSIEYYNSQIEEYYVPLRITYHKEMPNIGEVKNYEDLRFLCDDDSNLGIIQLLKSTATSASIQTEDFININAQFTEKLKHFLENSND
jgi:hypothetical protein